LGSLLGPVRRLTDDSKDSQDGPRT